ncbi:hypothetical protein J3459_014762 [Metarhizium acridum]|nr:hypothetical protein J3459_014762 [Metarhizium acridum]
MTTRLESSELYTVGWIAALPLECAAATALLDDVHKPPEGFEQHHSDSNLYFWGRMGEHNIVIASLLSGVDGFTSAATTASNLLSSLPQIRIGLLDIRLGDVVIGRPEETSGGVVQYDYGKSLPDQTWQPKGTLNKPPDVLLGALSNLQAQHEIEGSDIPNLLDKLWEVKAEDEERSE